MAAQYTIQLNQKRKLGGEKNAMYKKTKAITYLKTEKSAILERLDKKFYQHELIEQKIIKRADGLKNGQNKLDDYVAIKKLIDEQIMFLKELSGVIDDETENKKEIPIIGVFMNLFKR